MQDTSQVVRKLLAILAVVIGLFMIIIAPILVQISLDRVLASLVEVSKERPQYGSGIPLFALFYPPWRAIGFVAGVALIAIAPMIYRGKAWTYHVSLAAYAVPSISGMFMFLPCVSWVEGFPIPMALMWVGLLGFWAMVFLRKAERITKIAEFLVYTFVGMLATHSFVIGIGAQRMLLTRPGQPLFNGVEWWILTRVGEIDWIGALMLYVSIPLMALRKPFGWRIALIATVAILLIDVPTQIVRMATLDYALGALLAIGALILLLIPKLKQQFIVERSDAQLANA